MNWIVAGLPLLLLPLSVVADETKTIIEDLKVNLQEGTWKDVTALVKESTGKVVVVDLWSTSCLPCVEEFPHLVKLQKQHKENLVGVSFNLDYAGIRSKPPTYYRPRVEKFLKKEKAELHNFLSTDEAIEVMDALDILSIPAVYVYDKSGKLVKRFDESTLKDGEDKAFTYEKDINPLVEKLLN